MEASSGMPIYVAAAFATGAICTIAIDRLLRSEGGISRTEPGSEDAMNGLSTANGIEYHGLPKKPQPPPIVDGIEGCIGNTPMVRIRSLSEATGCEILAKAEVRLMFRLLKYKPLFYNRFLILFNSF